MANKHSYESGAGSDNSGRSVQEIIDNNSLTENEIQFLMIVTVMLMEYIGVETFSDCELKSVAAVMDIEIGSAKGILGSLAKKGILWTDRTSVDGPQYISFVDQDTMKEFF